METTAQEPQDLTLCPPEVIALDSNASALWVKFLRRTGIPMSAKSKKGKNAAAELWVDNNCRRAAIIRNFGIPSLIQRLAAAKDEVSRARVWWREGSRYFIREYGCTESLHCDQGTQIQRCSLRKTSREEMGGRCSNDRRAESTKYSKAHPAG